MRRQAPEQHRFDGRLLAMCVAIAVGLVLIGLLDNRVLGLLANSLWLAGASSAIAIPLGVATAVLMERSNVWGRRLWGPLFTAMLIVPVYLIASGWDAGLGRLGWVQWLWTGDTTGRLVQGWSAAIMIHAFIAIPWVILISRAGIRRGDREIEDATRLDATVGQTMRILVSRRLGLLVVINAMWITIQTFGEIVVSDLYQVRTFAEEIYLGLPLGQAFAALSGAALEPMLQAGGWTTEAARILVILCVAVAAWMMLFVLAPTPESQSPTRSAQLALGKARIPATLFVLCVATAVVFIPVLNLIIKAGFMVRSGPSGGEPGWSLVKAVESVVRVPQRFGDEFVWSLAIGLSTAVVVLIFAIVGSWLLRRHPNSGYVILPGMAVMLAVPGPAVGIMVIELLNHDHPWMIYLYDRTIVGPVLACAFRIVPLATLVGWYLFYRISDESLDHAVQEGVASFRQLIRIAIPATWVEWMMLGVVAFMFAFGELSGSILVVPPGIETLPRRVFGLIHAGVDDQVASICLFQWALIVAIGLCLEWVMRRRADTHSRRLD